MEFARDPASQLEKAAMHFPTDDAGIIYARKFT